MHVIVLDGAEPIKSSCTKQFVIVHMSNELILGRCKNSSNSMPKML